MKKLFLFVMFKVVLVIMLSFLTGCFNIQSWKYTAEQKSYEPAKINQNVVVLPFRDTRENINNTDYRYWALVPFIPYSRNLELNTPEGMPYVMTNMGRANETLAKATAEELNNAALFKNVYFDFNSAKSDLILEGTLKKFKLEDYWTFYGISFLGELLWVAGLPCGREYNVISIQYRLIDGSGKELFKKEYTKEETWDYSLYRNLENYRFEKLMKEINMELLQDLNKVVYKLK